MFKKYLGKLCKLPGFHRMDSGNVMALTNFGLQIYDLVTDILLAIEIFEAFAERGISLNEVFIKGSDGRDNALVICSLGSVIFVVFPYFSNVFAATQVKEKIRTNRMALAWFQGNTSIFVILTIMTGSCYVALQLVSSSLFGLFLLRSGITQYELNELSSLKIFLTVVFENIPQFIIQMLYLWIITLKDSRPTPVVYLSIISSVVSVTMAIATYCLNKKIVGVQVIHYYVEIAVREGYGRKSTKNLLLSPKAAVSIELSKEVSPGKMSFQKSGTHVMTMKSRGNVNRSPDLTDKEKLILTENVGLRQKMSIELAEIFGINKPNIEVGEAIIKSDGCIIHVIQFVSEKDKQKYFNTRRQSEHANKGKDIIINNKITISPPMNGISVDDDDNKDNNDDNNNDNDDDNDDDDDSDDDDDLFVDYQLERRMSRVPKTHDYVKRIWQYKKYKRKILRKVVKGILGLNKYEFDVKMYASWEDLNVDLNMVKKRSLDTPRKDKPDLPAFDVDQKSEALEWKQKYEEINKTLRKVAKYSNKYSQHSDIGKTQRYENALKGILDPIDHSDISTDDDDDDDNDEHKGINDADETPYIGDIGVGNDTINDDNDDDNDIKDENKDNNTNNNDNNNSNNNDNNNDMNETGSIIQMQALQVQHEQASLLGGPNKMIKKKSLSRSIKNVLQAGKKSKSTEYE